MRRKEANKKLCTQRKKNTQEKRKVFVDFSTFLSHLSGWSFFFVRCLFSSVHIDNWTNHDGIAWIHSNQCLRPLYWRMLLCGDNSKNGSHKSEMNSKTHNNDNNHKSVIAKNTANTVKQIKRWQLLKESINVEKCVHYLKC